MKLGRIAQILSSASIKQGLPAPLADTEPGGYSIDSRTAKAGDLFFAIRGENHDGHRFLVDAFDKGVVAAVVEKGAMGDDDVEMLIGVRGLARHLVEGARQAGIPKERAIFVEDPEEAAEILADQLRAGDVILVKGSRGVRMEKFVEKIKQRFDVLGGEN